MSAKIMPFCFPALLWAQLLEPIHIEAESFVAKTSSARTIASADAGGTDLAYIKAGDYFDYDVQIPSAGLYDLGYRTAGNTGGIVTLSVLRSGLPDTLARDTIPGSGGYKAPATSIISQIRLPAGNQRLRLSFERLNLSLSNVDFQWNWIELRSPGTFPFAQWDSLRTLMKTPNLGTVLCSDSLLQDRLMNALVNLRTPLYANQNSKFYQAYRDSLENLSVQFPWLQMGQSIPIATEGLKAQVAAQYQAVVNAASDLTPERKAHIITLLHMPERYQKLYTEMGIFLFDNNSMTDKDIGVIYRTREVTPAFLRDRVKAMSRSANIGGAISKFWGGVNVLSGVGGYTENAFPSDAKPYKGDGFTTVVAHELAHNFGAYIGGDSLWSARFNQLKVLSDTIGKNYPRGGPGGIAGSYYKSAPQEIIASTGNEWFLNSYHTFRLGLNRKDSNYLALDWVLLYMEFLSNHTDTTWFYQNDITGMNLEAKAIPLYRNTKGEITGALIMDTLYNFALNDSGLIQSYKKSYQASGKQGTSEFYEAERMVYGGLSYKSKTASDSSTGSGYLNYRNVNGDYIDWLVSFPKAKSISLQLRYANGDTASKSLELLLNQKVIDTLYFKSTGSWNQWKYLNVEVPNPLGTQVLTTRSMGNKNLNLDHIKLSFVPLDTNNIVSVPTSSNIVFHLNEHLLSLNNSVPGFLGFWNLKGQLIWGQNVSASAKIDLSHFEKGLYLVTLREGIKITQHSLRVE